MNINNSIIGTLTQKINKLKKEKQNISNIRHINKHKKGDINKGNFVFVFCLSPTTNYLLLHVRQYPVY